MPKQLINHGDKADLYISEDDMEQYFANLYLDEIKENQELQLLFEEAVEEVIFLLNSLKTLIFRHGSAQI